MKIIKERKLTLDISIVQLDEDNDAQVHIVGLTDESAMKGKRARGPKFCPLDLVDRRQALRSVLKALERILIHEVFPEDFLVQTEPDDQKRVFDVGYPEEQKTKDYIASLGK